MRRLGIYLVYDKQKIIDKYIGYMLDELRTCVDYLVVVCNVADIFCGKTILESRADVVFYRENIGYDAGGFKDALCKYIGWNKVCQYDELILANDSFYGPFKSMVSIFDDMDKRECDFWGLTTHAYKETEDETIPEHIQSYFVVVRKKMLDSMDFRDYWINMPYYRSFNEVVEKHEMVFTQHFNKLGFHYDCLADMSCNNSSNSKNNYTQYGCLQYELIAKRNFPFLKKKPIVFDALDIQTQENFKLALDYIDQNTTYDIDMIWENMIRIFNMSDIQRKFHLQYIVKYTKNETCTIHDNIIIVVFSKYLQTPEYILEYLDKLCGTYEIKLYTYDVNISLIYQEYGYDCLVLGNINDWEKELIRLAEKPYVCILHDCDMTSDEQYSCIGKSFFYNTWHNLLLGNQYIENLVELFNCQGRLGVLAPPSPNFSNYFGKAVKEWNIYYEEIKEFMDSNHISCQISKDKMPLSVSENVWIRGEILKKVIKYGLLRKEYLSFTWSYIAQSLGYYTGIVESDEYAALNEMNQQYYINQIINQVSRQYGETDTFLELQKHIFKGKLLEFCNICKKIYIYGTGYKAKEYQNMIPNVVAYIVSDGQVKPKYINGKTVFYLSEVKKEKDMGIVVCLNEKNQQEVIPSLIENAFRYICI